MRILYYPIDFIRRFFTWLFGHHCDAGDPNCKPFAECEKCRDRKEW